MIGGHLAPALAVIDALPKDYQVLFIGRKHAFEGDAGYSLEYKTITKLNIPFANITTGRLQRKFTKYTLLSLLKVLAGIVQAFSILNSFKPDVVLSFGGYLSVPVIFTAFIMRIPIVIHEQTQEAGLANRISSFLAKKICISWESSRKFFPKQKTVLTGNPVRNFQFSIFNFQLPKEDLPIVYVTGGSSGSHFVNILVEGCIKQLLESYIVIHQTGDSQVYKDFDRLQLIKDNLDPKIKERYVLKKFIDFEDVGSILNKASLVISRAGINTVTELISLEKPALLIPIPFSQNNEQLKNALLFRSLGLGETLTQESLGSANFLQKVKKIVNNINGYKIKDKSKTLINKNAAQKIIETIEYVKKSKKD